MKATGIVRKTDRLGRLVIPKEICRTHDIEPGTPLEIYVGDDGRIILRKYGARCALCGQAADPGAMHRYKQAEVCGDCFFDLNHAV